MSLQGELLALLAFLVIPTDSITIGMHVKHLDLTANDFPIHKISLVCSPMPCRKTLPHATFANYPTMFAVT